MNKKLVAVAIAGLLAAPLAQAQTANVTLYGRINIDMEFVNGEALPPTTRRIQPERLQGGVELVALRPARHRVARRRPERDFPDRERLDHVPTTGDGGKLAGRDSFVGLSGGWGTFKMGRFLAPYDDIHGIFGNDNTASTSILSTAALWAQGYAGQPETGGFDDRLSNRSATIRRRIRGSRQGRSSRLLAARTARTTTSRRSNSNAWSYGGYLPQRPGRQAGTAYEQHNKASGLAAGSSPTLSQVAFTDRAFSVAAR